MCVSPVAAAQDKADTISYCCSFSKQTLEGSVCNPAAGQNNCIQTARSAGHQRPPQTHSAPHVAGLALDASRCTLLSQAHGSSGQRGRCPHRCCCEGPCGDQLGRHSLACLGRRADGMQRKRGSGVVWSQRAGGQTPSIASTQAPLLLPTTPAVLGVRYRVLSSAGNVLQNAWNARTVAMKGLQVQLPSQAPSGGRPSGRRMPLEPLAALWSRAKRLVHHLS